MDEIVKFIFDSIVWIIVPIATFGVACSILALIGICWYETRELADSRITVQGSRPALWTMVHDGDSGDNLVPPRVFWGIDITMNHLRERVSALFKAANITKRDGEPKEDSVLPQLEDLHALTIHNEQNRNCAAVLNTIISVLLILGILGTLTGIHTIIQSDVDPQRIGEALVPSALAVGSTIILIALRGVYLYYAHQYVKRLDWLTVTLFFPRFRPRRKDNESIKHTTGEIEELVKSHSNMSREESGNYAAGMKEKMQEVTEEVTTLLHSITEAKKKNAAPHEKSNTTPWGFKEDPDTLPSATTTAENICTKVRATTEKLIKSIKS